MTTQAPRGRFAPSPTGPLHFGSLIAAVGSYLSIKSRNGTWLVRMEDLDPPREQAGAADQILKTLEAYALHWDETVVYQSQRNQFYDEALQKLTELNLIYACQCSRKNLGAETLPGNEGNRYPGTCRELNLQQGDTSMRVRVPQREIFIHDQLQGATTQNLYNDIGDFIVRRRDGLFSYQLAIVIDDSAQEISEVCRGTDLMDSTARQIYLQQALGYPTPDYMHLPIAVNNDGQKLSKQTHAPAINPAEASATLSKALNFLGHPPPQELIGASPVELLQWGVEYWDIASIPAKLTIETNPE